MLKQRRNGTIDCMLKVLKVFEVGTSEEATTNIGNSPTSTKCVESKKSGRKIDNPFGVDLWLVT